MLVCVVHYDLNLQGGPFFFSFFWRFATALNGHYTEKISNRRAEIRACPGENVAQGLMKAWLLLMSGNSLS